MRAGLQAQGRRPERRHDFLQADRLSEEEWGRALTSIAPHKLEAMAQWQWTSVLLKVMWLGIAVWGVKYDSTLTYMGLAYIIKLLKTLGSCAACAASSSSSARSCSSSPSCQLPRPKSNGVCRVIGGSMFVKVDSRVSCDRPRRETTTPAVQRAARTATGDRTQGKAVQGERVDESPGRRAQLAEASCRPVRIYLKK